MKKHNRKKNRHEISAVRAVTPLRFGAAKDNTMKLNAYNDNSDNDYGEFQYNQSEKDFRMSFLEKKLIERSRLRNFEKTLEKQASASGSITPI